MAPDPLAVLLGAATRDRTSPAFVDWLADRTVAEHKVEGLAGYPDEVGGAWVGILLATVDEGFASQSVDEGCAEPNIVPAGKGLGFLSAQKVETEPANVVMLFQYHRMVRATVRAEARIIDAF